LLSLSASSGPPLTHPLDAKSLWLMEKLCRGPLTPRAHATYSAAKWDKVG
jgi:hypothetical protein